MCTVGVYMGEWELVAIISSYSRYGKTRLSKELEERLKDLRRYKYPKQGKKRVYQTEFQRKEE